jgi:Gpi18-like mannosyltransferase
MFFFSLAFAFKLQAIFLLPFLGVYTLRRKIPWWTFLLIPAVYVTLSLPTILVGRPWLDVLTIYAHQTEKFPKWSSFTPTLYLPLQGRVPLTPTLSTLVVIGAVILTSIWILWVWRKTKTDTHTSILLTALASVAFVPFILPRMHERYFYPQDVISLVAVFFLPELWFLPILSQVISVIAYGPFLFGNNFHVPIFGRNLNALLYIALPIQALIVAWILWKQLRGLKAVPAESKP